MSCAKFTQGLRGKVPFNLDSTCWKPFAADCNFAHSKGKIVLSVWRLGRRACDTPVFAKGGQVIRNQTYYACLSVPRAVHRAVAVSFVWPACASDGPVLWTIV